MGNWGPGGFANDHAADLVSIETDRWATELETACSGELSMGRPFWE